MGGGNGSGSWEKLSWEKLSDEELAMLEMDDRLEMKTLQRHLKSAITRGELELREVKLFFR